MGRDSGESILAIRGRDGVQHLVGGQVGEGNGRTGNDGARGVSDLTANDNVDFWSCCRSSRRSRSSCEGAQASEREQGCNRKDGNKRSTQGSSSENSFQVGCVFALAPDVLGF